MSLRPLGLALAGALLLTSCQALPSWLGGPQPGTASGPLGLDALAETSTDAETGTVAVRVHLSWAKAPGARVYELIRRFEGNAGRVLSSAAEPGYVDASLQTGQTATYRVRALGPEAQELSISEERAVTPLARELEAPASLEPTATSALGADEKPTLKWGAVPNASAYRVEVRRGDNDELAYSALVREPQAKYGDASPIQVSRFASLFPVQEGAALRRGVVYRWTVEALRLAGGDDLGRAKAVERRPAAGSRFSLGG